MERAPPRVGIGAGGKQLGEALVATQDGSVVDGSRAVVTPGVRVGLVGFRARVKSEGLG